jgi:ribonuclease P protein component
LKLQTVKENDVFLKAYRKGKFSASKPVCVYFIKGKPGERRLGITVSKKIGTAVTRNRVKRIIRAAFVESFGAFPAGYDYIILARPDIVTLKSDELTEIFRSRVIPFVLKCAKCAKVGGDKTGGTCGANENGAKTL